MPILYPLARSALFRLSPEAAHRLVASSLAALPAPARALLRATYQLEDPRLHRRLWGIDFPHPVGLAAGFDKSGHAFNALGALGFGSVEIGTITAHAQPGNPRPRIFRLPQDRALLNRMGFNNPGAAAVAAHLERVPIETVLGINLGKSKITPLEEAVADYLQSLELLERFAHYLVINVSSPNTPGLRELQDARPLRSLLHAIAERRRAPGSEPKPVLLKLAPDLSAPQIEQAVGIALEEGISGIVAVNTTIARTGLHLPPERIEVLGPGGISGAPLRARALEVIAQVRRLTRGAIPIIGVGGIFGAEDAWNAIRAGADLIQLYTGFIYQGPGIIRTIQHGLLERLKSHGLSSLAEAVGTAE